MTRQDLLTVDSVTALRHLVAEHGDLARTTGHHEAGDGGAMTYRWDAGSRTPDNRGTVLTGKRTRRRRGRWLALHGGTLDLRVFGVRDAAAPADEALDAAIEDPAVHRVEVRTPILLRRHHLVRRSGLTFDFGGQMVAGGSPDGPAGLLRIAGRVEDDALSAVASDGIAENTDVLPVGDSSAFTQDDWWVLALADGRRRLLQITEIVDARRVRVGHKLGWPVAAGSTLRWRRAEPVRDVAVTGLVHDGDPGATSPLLAVECAVDVHIAGVHATRHGGAVIRQELCTTFTTTDCTLTGVLGGGQSSGPLVELAGCQFGRLEGCHASRAHGVVHLADSSHCLIRRCDGDGEDLGAVPVRIAGSYEHDLTFEGTSGLLEIGELAGAEAAARRISVRQHVGPRVVASSGVSELTLTDVHAVSADGVEDSASMRLSVDGLVMRGCRTGTLALSGPATRARRPAVIQGCQIAQAHRAEMISASVDTPVLLRHCVIEGLDGASLAGSGELSLVGCELRGEADSAPMRVSAGVVRLRRTRIHGVAIRLVAGSGQRVTVGEGTVFSGHAGSQAALSRESGAAIDWCLGGVSFTGPGTHLRIDTGVNRVRLVSASFAGGRLELPETGFASGDSHLLLSRCSGRDLTTDIAESAVIDHLLQTA